MRSITTTLFALILFAAAAQPAAGEDAAPPPEAPATVADTGSPDEGDAAPSSPNVLGIGAKVGVALPQLDSALDTSFGVHLELSYRLPFWGSRFGVYTGIGFSMPEGSGSGSDARLPGGAYTWEVTQRQTIWDLGLALRVMPWKSDWNVGFLAGSRMTFVSTLTDGKAGGEPFGEHDEKGTLYGAFASVLGEYRLGPGAIFLELNYGLSLQDLRTTGDLPLHELYVLAGYRFDILL